MILMDDCFNDGLLRWMMLMDDDTFGRCLWLMTMMDGYVCE